MPLVWNLSGPLTLPGRVFTTTTGTAVAFSAGVALAYTGLAVANPATVGGACGTKLVLIKASFQPSVVSANAVPVPWGIMKLTGQGTASNGGLSLWSGAIFQQGTAGTGTGIAIVGGTFSVINGTAAGTGSNCLYWAEMCGSIVNGTGAGTAAWTMATVNAADLSGFTTVMPGETAAIGLNAAMTGFASLTWLEVPLNSGS
jgi:hypothetical protein